MSRFPAVTATDTRSDPGPSRPPPGLGRRLRHLPTLGLLAMLAACATAPTPAPGTASATGTASAPTSTSSVRASTVPTPSTPATTLPAGQALPPTTAAPITPKDPLADLPWSDRGDFEDADRGFIAALPDGRVSGGGRTVWDLDRYAFLSAERAPDTVNPSLWRQARLNMRNGLYRVTEGIYQLRGIDLANMTIIEGRQGLIVVDPLTAVETARAGLELYYAHRPRRPVVAVIYTHSHVDHFGGVKGVVDEAAVRAGRAKIYAPAGFTEHAISENVIAGTAMQRRAAYQFGTYLPPGVRGQVDAGLGKAVAVGQVSLILPTDIIREPISRRRIAGVEIEFQLAPGTEAPAEMHLYLPATRVLNLAENATHTHHNLLPLRGAEVRDALAWSHHLNEAIDRYGSRSEILIGQHHWPTWGNARVTKLLSGQRDLYKYVHDQTLRLINYGYTPDEIAERLRLPASLASQWALRDYYGTVRHNARAIYQRYLGWYDGNPAHLDRLPPVDQARRYLRYMGGADAVINRAREDFARGDLRWVVQALDHVIFAEPQNQAARQLQAEAFEKLGFAAESATWRNAYLNGAHELRSGPPRQVGAGLLSPDLLQALPLGLYFDLMGVRLNGTRAEGRHIVVNWDFTDVRERYVLRLENSALTWSQGRQDPQAHATVRLSRATLDQITLRRTNFPEAVSKGQVVIEGRPGALSELLGLLDPFNPGFEIVEPRRVDAP